MAMRGRQSASEGDFIGDEEIREQANLLERIMSHFDVDDQYLAAMVANQVQLAQIERKENEILREIRDQRAPQIVGEFPFEMSHDVPADTQPEDPNMVERVPSEETDTRIVSLSLGWPDGANNAVGIRVRTGNGLTLFPRNGQDDFVAFNDFAETFGLDYRLDPGEKLIADTINVDTTNNHFVNIVPQIVEHVDED